MSPQSLFSIITVCLNEKRNIRRTCESILAQSFTDFEWIVIDGGSTDGTLDVLTEYKSQISCLISEPDAGIYNAMNKGIRYAKGEYLIFMNGGDCFSNPNVLLTVSKAPKVDFIWGDVFKRQKKKIKNKLSRHYLIKHGFPHQACYFKKELFIKHGGYNESLLISADYELIIRFIYKYKASYFYIPKVLALFNRDGISCNKNLRITRKLEAHEIRKKYFSIWYLLSYQAIKWEYRKILIRLQESKK